MSTDKEGDIPNEHKTAHSFNELVADGDIHVSGNAAESDNDIQITVISATPRTEEELEAIEQEVAANPALAIDRDPDYMPGLDDEDETPGLEAGKESQKPGLEVDWYNEGENPGLESGSHHSGAGLEAGDATTLTDDFSTTYNPGWGRLVGDVRFYKMGDNYVLVHPKKMNAATQKLYNKRLQQIMADATINKGWTSFYAHEKTSGLLASMLGIGAHGKFSPNIMTAMQSARDAHLDMIKRQASKGAAGLAEDGTQMIPKDDATPKQRRLIAAYNAQAVAGFAGEASKKVGPWAVHNPFAQIGQRMSNLKNAAKEELVKAPIDKVKTRGVLGVGGFETHLS